MIDEILDQMVESCEIDMLQKRRPKKAGAYVALFLTVTDMLRCQTLQVQYREDFCQELQDEYDLKAQYIVYVGFLLSAITAKTIFKQKICNFRGSKSERTHYKVVVAGSLPSLQCHYCHSETNLKKCASCNDARYCSPVCQQKDWVRHVLECRAICSAKADVDGQFDPSVSVLLHEP